MWNCADYSFANFPLFNYIGAVKRQWQQKRTAKEIICGYGRILYSSSLPKKIKNSANK